MFTFLVAADFCEENGNGCVDVNNVIENDDMADLVFCCCDTDLCNDDSNGAEGTYFSVIAISSTLVMAMTI